MDKDKLINWLLFLALSLIWGSSFLLMKVGMQALSPYQVASLRMLSASLVLIPFAPKAFKTVPKQKIGLVIFSGFLGSFFPAYLFCFAETQIDSALTGMLNSLTPLLTVVIGALFFTLQVTMRKVLGIVVGLVGLVLLLTTNGHVNLNRLVYANFVLVATLMYAINVNLVGRYLRGINAITIATVAFTFLLFPSMAVLLVTGYFRLPLWRQAPLQSTLASCVLGIGGTAIASVLFYRLVKSAGVLFSSMVTYGIPFVAVLWGILYGEQVTPLQIGSLGVILLGVYITNSNKKNA